MARRNTQASSPLRRGLEMPVVPGARRLAVCLLTFVLACGSTTEPDPSPGGGGDNGKAAALTLSPDGATLLVGESLTLAALAVDDAGEVLEDVQVDWSASPPGAVTVTGGRIEGVAVGFSVITARVGSASATLNVLVMPSDESSPSSAEVLTSAHEAGLINDEELLAYRVYAAFGDPRLPLQYKARVDPGFDATSLEDLRQRFNDLSAPMQAALGMYMLRPADPGSWLNAPTPDARLSSMEEPRCRPFSGGWSYVKDPASSKVRVWYQVNVPGQRDRALKLDEAIAKDIWPKLMALGLKEPLTDEAAPCNGGSSQLDLYLVRNMADRGLTVPEGWDRTQAATYILLPDNADENALKGAATHELMHAIQWSYKTRGRQADYGWIRDATANWAIDHVYGTLLVGPNQQQQFEHMFAGCFMNSPDLPLESQNTGYCTSSGAKEAGRDYGAYLFFQFLAKKYGPSVVVAALAKLTTETSSLTAVDSVVPGNLEKVWPEFSKVLWNGTPISTRAESFKAWDNLKEVSRHSDLNADLSGWPEASDELHDELYNLSNRYYLIRFSDPGTRSVLFHNGWFKNITESKDPVKVFAFWKDEAGAWHDEDWSEYEYVGFCRDMQAQRAQDVVVVVSNAKFAPGGGGTLKAAETPSLKRSNVGCWKYKGTTRSVLKGTGWSGRGKTLDANVEFTVPGGFAIPDYDDPSFPHTKRVGGFMLMPPKGDFTLDIDYGSGGCRYTHGPATYPLVDAGGMLLTNPFNELQSPDPDIQDWLSHPSRAYTAALGDARLVSVSVTGGPDCRGPELDVPGNILLTDDGGTKPVVSPTGELSGQFVHEGINFSWALQPQREP
ncbi:Ig-like domain-containing protein [Corallococcus carmarthensis]|uniref:Ig-like domain-containing protein n=1 Tax=Corallococcus carmarthensis TaxID=2316728 RepID=UPI00148B3482|nr:Ig-like domain-containing protein [Corallococcus carmarthensis]NOK19989.1 Ig-like domain-containing protein [Corallococcus carmarthensis]